MVQQPLRVLAINPGTRYMGIAVIEESELDDWGMKVIQGDCPEDKIKKAVETVRGLLARWQPDALAIKLLHPSRSSSILNKLVKEIKNLCQRKGLRVLEYSIEDLHAFFLPGELANKKRLAEMVASAHEVLLPELRKEQTNKNAYYVRMFEAVAMATVGFHELDKH